MIIKTVGIVGSRKFPEEMYPRVFELLDRFYVKYNPKIFCSGGAKGIDAATECWAKTKDMSRLIYRPTSMRWLRAWAMSALSLRWILARAITISCGRPHRCAAWSAGS